MGSGLGRGSICSSRSLNLRLVGGLGSARGTQTLAARQGPALPSGSARETSCRWHSFPNQSMGNNQACARPGAKYKERKHLHAACYMLF